MQNIDCEIQYSKVIAKVGGSNELLASFSSRQKTFQMSKIFSSNILFSVSEVKSFYNTCISYLAFTELTF